MAQALIRNIDDDLLADYREAAKRSGRSLEAELREALKRARPLAPARREELIEAARRIRAMTPAGVRQTPSEVLIREDRDGYREA
jgi:plasmid stability protein